MVCFLVLMATMAVSSESASQTLVNIKKLNRTNYRTWRFDVQLILKHFNVWDIPEGTSPRLPATIPPAQMEKRQAREDKAYSIICLSLSPQQKLWVEGQRTAEEAWNHLRTIYELITLARVAGLQKDFESLKMEDNEPMAVFLSWVDKDALALVDVRRTLPDQDMGLKMLKVPKVLRVLSKAFIGNQKRNWHQN